MYWHLGLLSNKLEVFSFYNTNNMQHVKKKRGRDIAYFSALQPKNFLFLI